MTVESRHVRIRRYPASIHIVIPFVELIRVTYDCKNEDGSPMRAFVTCDGEAQQIAVFQMVTMLALFVAALIDFGKSPASCSAIAQSSDDSNFFKATKCVLKGVMDYGNASLEKKMREYLQTRLKLTGEQPHEVCVCNQESAY
jgi:hypothetical protein